MAMEFTAPNNPAGQNLLRIVARGSSIIAELLRLSHHVPPVFALATEEDRQRYGPILFDFSYMGKTDSIEERITSNRELVDLDEEFRDNHIELLHRFFKLFESIYKYNVDLRKYLSDLHNGVYIQESLEQALSKRDGKQLLSEALYLYGVMLLLLDMRIEGIVRERMLISYYRYQRATDIPNIDEVCTLCAATGFVRGRPRPNNYPEDFFARIPMPTDFVQMVIGRIRTDDIYLQVANYPAPRHRSAALASQAAMLYVILYFFPELLHNDQAAMREIVDKHFPDNWVLSYYMGFTVDLSMQWANYKAAKIALGNIITIELVTKLTEKYMKQQEKSLADLAHLLTEGVIDEMFLMRNIPKTLEVLRDCNVTVRWLMLHSTTGNKKLRELVQPKVDPDRLLLLILNTAQFEYRVKRTMDILLAGKTAKWDTCKAQASANMRELGDYFSGEKALKPVEKNAGLQTWAHQIAEKVAQLDFNDATLAGRKISQLIRALEEVEQFRQIEASLQVKESLHHTREQLRMMLYYVNVQEVVMVTIAVVSDMSYGWGIINDFIPLMQTRIKAEAATVIKLRAVFLKLSSILELPCIRLSEINSEDIISVSEFYSSELVAFVRQVLEVIPNSMFKILDRIIDLQTHKLKELPQRVEKDTLKDYAQLPERTELARLTHRVSVFTEGIMAMETTLVGVIQVNPKDLLEDGIRKELVEQISRTLHEQLRFGKNGQLMPQLMRLAETLDGYRRSFEYIQDYVRMYGLRIWQEEFSRIINFNVQMECNSFMTQKIYDFESEYQSDAVPLRLFPPIDKKALTFMGRLTNELLDLTKPSSSIYVDQMNAWYNYAGEEIVGVRTFSQLILSISVFGLRGVDKLLCFMMVKGMQQFVSVFQNSMNKEMRKLLTDFEADLTPTSSFPDTSKSADKLYSTMFGRLERWNALFLDTTSRVGHMQLIRRSIAYELAFSAKIDSNSLSNALDTLNAAVINDVREHYRSPGTRPYPGSDNSLLVELSEYLETAGRGSPLTKIYVTSENVEFLPVLMFVFVISQLPRFEYSKTLGTLVCKSKKAMLDGVPFLVGVITLLRQFHSTMTNKFLAYLGQYVRWSISSTVGGAKSPGTEFTPEVQNVLVFLEQFCKFSNTPRRVVENYVPPYIFDRFQR